MLQHWPLNLVFIVKAHKKLSIICSEMTSRKDKVYVTVLTMFHMEEDVLEVGGARAPGQQEGRQGWQTAKRI